MNKNVKTIYNVITEFWKELHDECMRVENVPSPSGTDSSGGKSKQWKISGSWRKDHVLDAFMMAMWCILAGQLNKIPQMALDLDPWEEARKANDFQRLQQERRELLGEQSNLGAESLFEEIYGRPRSTSTPIGFLPSNYKDY